MSSLAPAITSLVSALAPIEDPTLRLQAGIFAGETWRSLASLKWSSVLRWIPWKSNTTKVYINERIEGDALNPLYTQMEEYMVKKFIKRINQSSFIPQHGDIILHLQKQDGNSKMETQWNGHYIRMSIVHKDDGNEEKKSSFTKDIKSIVIECQTLDANDLKGFLQEICKSYKQLNTSVTYYRPVVHDNDTKSVMEWSRVDVKTNKTLENTVYSDLVNKDIFEDIDWFMNNESWYASRGLSYKKSYLVYGPPGSGKTSITKILANKYKLPVFILDMQMIKTNNDFNKLVTDINYFASNGKYIVSVEDVDRFGFFKDRWYHQGDDNITMACLMNFLDGVMETHGRICIFTANDVDKVLKYPAVIRPGRIDKIVEVKECDEGQIKRLYRNFFNEELEVKLCDQLFTPAQMIKWMFCLSKQQVLDRLTGTSGSNGNDLMDKAFATSEPSKKPRKTPKEILKERTAKMNRIRRTLQRYEKMQNTYQKKLGKVEDEVKDRTEKVALWVKQQKLKKQKQKEAAKKKAAKERKVIKEKAKMTDDKAKMTDDKAKMTDDMVISLDDVPVKPTTRKKRKRSSKSKSPTPPPPIKRLKSIKIRRRSKRLKH
jgi:hypothetical protein